jgi:rare lipoprotein A
MRPHLNLRAHGAIMALGALCPAISLSVLPGAAQSDDTHGNASAHAAIAADITPGKSRLNVLAGRRAAVNGRLRSGSAGRRALLQRQSGRGWTTIARATTRAGGAFGFAFRPQRPGSARLRVLVDAASRQIGRLNVYRRAAVSWYGPGLYGNRLSCGGRLTPGTLGVAHKTLPCGSHVTLRRGDRVIRVRVVDRGPYVGGREFDLTSATRARLHFGGVGSLLVAS